LRGPADTPPSPTRQGQQSSATYPPILMQRRRDDAPPSRPLASTHAGPGGNRIWNVSIASRLHADAWSRSITPGPPLTALAAADCQ
jgi:hypothetical protein